MSREILYIGNNLSNKTKYPTTMEALSRLLSKQKYNIYKTSSKQNKFLRLFEMCFSILKHRRKIDYILIDTYSTHNFYFAFLTSQIARIYKIKYIPILHGGNLPSRLKQSPKLSNLIFKNSYLNIAPSNYLKYKFEEKGYSVKLVPNIIEIKAYKYKLRDSLNPKLLWVRSFKNIYNPTLAIEVLKLLKKNFPSAILCMVGPENDDSFNKTKTLVKKYNLESSVEFTGVLTKKEWHKKSEYFDIFINTTNFDNTPVSVIEAMALGLPVVSTNVGGMPYLINNKVDGILVDSNNAKLMSKAILKILEDNFTDLAINARKKVESYDWDIVKNLWKEILK